MVITNQGVAIQPCFSSKSICNFVKIELAVRKAFWEVLIKVLSFGFGVAVLVLAHLLTVLLVDGFSLVHTIIYGAHKQTHNKEKEIKVLSLSSNPKQLRYGDWSNIFGWFSNGMAGIMLEMAW